MDPVAIVTQNLAEVLGGERSVITLRSILQERPLHIYWGTATTGLPHIGYLIPLLKIADMLQAGCKITILLADLHAALDHKKTPWELLDERVWVYEQLIRAVLTSLGAPCEKLSFVRGQTYQMEKPYVQDMLRLMSMVTVANAKKASAEVVKQDEHPLLSGLAYPLLQVLDEEYLHVDAQLGGVDQRKIFTLAEKMLPKLGYQKRVHLMNPMLPSLQSNSKMSSSEGSKISLLDTPEQIQAKIQTAFCPEKDTQSPLFALLKMVVFPLCAQRQERFLTCSSLEELCASYHQGTVHPADLKNTVSDFLQRVLEPVRLCFAKKEARDHLHRAYSYLDQKTPHVVDTSSILDAPPSLVLDAPCVANTSHVSFGVLQLRVGKIESSAPGFKEQVAQYRVDLGDAGKQTVFARQGLKPDQLVVMLCQPRPKQRWSYSVLAVDKRGNCCKSEETDGGRTVIPPKESHIGERVCLFEHKEEYVHQEPGNTLDRMINDAIRKISVKQHTVQFEDKPLCTSSGTLSIQGHEKTNLTDD